MKTILKNSMKSLIVLAVACMGISTVANAEVLKRDTVYVIKDMDYPVPIGAYKVENNDTLTDAGTQNINGQDQAVGIAVCTKNKRIFVSYESFNASDGVVDVIDAETFQVLSQLTIPGTQNIAGMVFSEDRRRLYVVDRGQRDIFVYGVDADGSIARVESEEFNATSGVYGIDVWGNKLYCTHATSTVTIYDLNTELKVDEYTTTSTYNMAIAVDGSDSSNVLVYTTWTNQSTNASILTQHNVNTDVERRINLGRDGRGLSVNPALGLVYAVTGDSGDATAPELRTYRKDQFTSATPTTPTPLDTEALIQGRDATDVFAAGITFNPDVYIEIIDPADKNISVGMVVTFEITIQNQSSEYNMTLNDMENIYNTDDISFVSSSLTPDDTTDDGNISWSNLDITIAPDGNYTFTKTFKALQEVNCSTETIQVTDAELDTPEAPTQLDPFGNTLYFDIVAACGCEPELEERDSGSTLGMLSALMLAMFTLLFGSLAMRRKRTN